MPVTYVTTNLTGPGPLVNLGATANNAVVVGQGVIVGTTGAGTAIVGTGDGQNAFIYGFVGAQASPAINLSGNDTFVTVGSTGVVQALEPLSDGTGTAVIFFSGAKGGVSNQGSIRGDFTVSFNGEGLVVNSGLIESYGPAISIVGDGTVRNTGTIIGSVSLFGGGSVTNSGSIIGSVSLSGGGSVTNSGAITGTVSLGGLTADVYDGSAGILSGQVIGNGGNDTLTGGAFAETLRGGTDNDTLRGNGGIDSLQGDAGNDTIFFSIEDAVVNGGADSDTARNTYNDFGLTFDMGANSIEFYFGSQAGETIVTSANIRMDVDAGGGNDLIIGGGQGDGLAGGGGDDTIFGGLGPDTIGGGFGDDRIESGGGNDVLNGESGNDTFVYEGVGGGNDTINGFEIGRDKIEILRSGFLSPTQWNAGALDPARFVASAAPAPIIGTACFLFDNAGPGAGQVFWNDGSGAATGIFQVTGINFGFFSAQDFVLV